MPGATAAASHVTQLPRDSQCDQCRSATTWCFPLAPESGPESQPDPASESDQHLGRFAEAEIAAPAPHIRGQLFHCRLDADALDRKSTRLNSSHANISYAVFCLKKKRKATIKTFPTRIKTTPKR